MVEAPIEKGMEVGRAVVLKGKKEMSLFPCCLPRCGASTLFQQLKSSECGFCNKLSSYLLRIDPG